MNNNTIYIQSNKDYLMHYGVPGMKWGVRKSTYKSMSRKERKATRKGYRKELRDIGEKRRRRTNLLTESGYGLSKKKAKKFRKLNEQETYGDGLQSKGEREQWKKLYKKTREASRQKAAREFTKKYGETKLKEVDRQEVKDGAAFTAAIIGGTAALVVAKRKLGSGSAYRAGQRDAKKYMSYMNSGNMAKAAKVAKRYM